MLDFGISKIDSPQEIAATSTQTMLGTPLYMSPEQVRSARDVDARTDIWSLGVVLYEMLTGQLPFLAEEASAVIAAIVSDPITPVAQLRPDLPAPLAAAVMKALEKDRNLRFRLVDDFSAALLPFAPPWFRPPAPPISTRTPRPLLPAQLSNSLAESLDEDRTIADPDAAPDALKPLAAPVTGFEPTSIAPSPAALSQPSGVTRTTAGGDKRKTTGDVTRLVLAVLLGIIAAAGILAVAVLVKRSRDTAAPAPPTPTATTTTATPTLTAPPTATTTATATATATAPPAPSSTATARLDVTMSGGWCTIRVDGAAHGPTPIAHLTVAAGPHDVSCTPSSGVTKRQHVNVEPGEEKRVKFAGP